MHLALLTMTDVRLPRVVARWLELMALMSYYFARLWKHISSIFGTYSPPVSRKKVESDIYQIHQAVETPAQRR